MSNISNLKREHASRLIAEEPDGRSWLATGYGGRWRTLTAEEAEEADVDLAPRGSVYVTDEDGEILLLTPDGDLLPPDPAEEQIATADVDSEETSCCGAFATYSGDGDLYCRACFGEVVWA